MCQVSSQVPVTVRSVSSLDPSIDWAIEALGYTGATGLVANGQVDPEDLATRFMWRELAQRVELDAVFFQSGVPLIGFTKTSASDLRDLRQQLWNYGRLPALIAVTDERRATVYNALRSPSDKSGDGGVLATGALGPGSTDLEAFDRRQVEAGTLGLLFGESFRTSDRVDSVLLANLRVLRRELAPTASSMALSHADVVIGASILAAYLSDRGVLTRGHVTALCNVGTLQDSLEGGQTTFTALLTGLAQRFNGDVFSPATASVRHLRDQDLREIGRFLRGEDIVTGQGALWPYDFSVIPPEVISSVYETLLEEDRQKHASFFTPRSVVNLVLDEVMPLDTPFKGSIADLSCGSGAFITEAFRRLVFQRRVRGERIDMHELSQILQERVFGVDIDDFAARLTVFGLYLALLEEVEPRTIWEDVVLPRLYMRTVISADAFADHPLRARRFKAVIGNPPWKSELSSEAVSFLRQHNQRVGDKQIAQAFVWLAEQMLESGGRLGLVLPSKSSLYNRSRPNRQFRADLFRRLQVRTIVDLSLVRRNLFSGAIGPSVIIVADANPGTVHDQDGVYLAVRPRTGSGIVDGFVVAPEDFKNFSPDAHDGVEFAWKALLWGTDRDVQLLRRLQANFTSLGSRAQERGWNVAQGIKVAGPQRDASGLIGLPQLNQGIGQLTPVSRGGAFERKTLHRSQDREFFESPKMVVSRTLSRDRVAVTVVDEPAIFSSNLTGIDTRGDEEYSLPILGLVAASSVIQYWQFFTSASWGVERPSVETNEILTWPLPQIAPIDILRADELWQLTRLRGVTPEIRKIIDAFVADLYGLTLRERQQINAGVMKSLSADRPSRLFGSPVTDDDLAAYRSALVEHLRAGWQTVQPSAASMRQGGLAGVKVHFGETNDLGLANWTEEEWVRAIGSLDRTSSTTAVISQPSLLYFDLSNVYLVKSLDADRWSQEAALSDGDAIYAAAVFGEQVAH